MLTKIIFALILLFIIWLAVIYNRLVVLRNRVKEAWSDIKIQLKRRYNLIPNLVRSVKAYAKHEREIFEQISKARSAALAARGTSAQAEAENKLTAALKSIIAIAENYPDLKASENFKSLQEELTDTENKISAARRFYNGMVRDLNTKIEIFPNNLIAKWFRFKKFDLFDLAGGQQEKNPPRVDF